MDTFQSSPYYIYIHWFFIQNDLRCILGIHFKKLCHCFNQPFSYQEERILGHWKERQHSHVSHWLYKPKCSNAAKPHTEREYDPLICVSSKTRITFLTPAGHFNPPSLSFSHTLSLTHSKRLWDYVLQRKDSINVQEFSVIDSYNKQCKTLV